MEYEMHVARTEEIRNEYTVLVRKAKGKRIWETQVWMGR
jgi:hypothetical protein